MLLKIHLSVIILRMKYFKKFNVFKSPDNDIFYSERKSYFLSIILITSILIGIIGIVITTIMKWKEERIAVSISIIVNVVNYFLLQKNHLKSVSFLTLSFLIGISLFFIYNGSGIYVSTIVLFPFIIILASFLLNKVYYIIYSVSTILSFIIVSNIWWILKPKFPTENDFYGDLTVIALLLITTSIIMYLYTKDLEYHVNRLEKSERKLKNIFDNIQDIYFETSLDGRILEVSPSAEKYYPFKRKMLINKPLAMFYKKPKIREKFLNILSKKGRINNFEITLDLYGKEYTVLINAILVKNQDGEPSKIVGSMRDITEKREMEEHLKQIQKLEALGTLAGGIVHDFNNILTAINGYTTMALLTIEKQNPLYNDLVAIKESVKRASQLTNQILTFSRKQIPKKETISIEEIINRLQPLLSRLIGEHIEIKIDISPTTPPIKGDPVQIEQILMNLLVNARDAVNQKQTTNKTVIIQTCRKKITDENSHLYQELKPGEYTCLSVKDNGVGIPPEIRNKIFDPFFTTKERGKGTGLGLATVFGVVKQHQGEIWVNSEEGKGTEITILWPSVNENTLFQSPPLTENNKEISEISNKTTDANPKPRETDTTTILFVEDDKQILEFALKVLKSKGYNVFTAQNGEEALEIFTNNTDKIELLITDAIMPKMGGNELISKVKKISPNIKVIVTTGYTEDDIWENLEKDNRANYTFLSKPYGPEELIEAVQKLLS